MLHKLRSAVRLSFAEWFLFLQAWVWLLLFDIGLRTCPFPGLQVFAAPLSIRPVQPPEQTEGLILSLKTAVDRACYNHLYPMTCLCRSLALQKMLAQRGIATELKIGVQKELGILSAHAWVEYQGEPIGEPEKVTGQYIALMPYQKQ
jgi:hypothetical protein